jgi:RNA polymerase sigma factor (sigma-70 family)
MARSSFQPLSDNVNAEFAQCYQAEMPGLVTYLMKCGANLHDAADAAQRAFMELYQDWEVVSNARAWLRKVAYRQFLRAMNNDRILDPRYYETSVLPASARLELREEEQALLSALRQLPVSQRQVFALHFDQFGTREISEILQISEPAVRQNLKRARYRLKELLELHRPG